MSADFNWNDAGLLVVREARDTVVYTNTIGDVVIRQRPLSQEDDDSTIFIPIHRVRALIERLEGLLREE